MLQDLDSNRLGAAFLLLEGRLMRAGVPRFISWYAAAPP